MAVEAAEVRQKDVYSLMEEIDKFEYRINSEDAAAILSGIAAGLSPCTRYKKPSSGIVAYDQRGREVGSAYSGPVRGCTLCDEKCQLDEIGYCFDITAGAALNTNPNTTKGMQTIFSSDLPLRRDLRELVGAEACQIYYLRNGLDTDGAEGYIQHLRCDAKIGISVDYYEISAKCQELARTVFTSIAGLGRPLTFDEAGLLMALVNSRRTKCRKHKIGCVAFSSLQDILGFGYNGPISGDQHCSDVGCFKDKGEKCIGAHAEINMLTNLSDKTLIRGGTVFLSYSTCFECFKSLVHIGVARVVFFGRYQRISTCDDATSDVLYPIHLLAENVGVSVQQFTSEGLVDI